MNTKKSLKLYNDALSLLEKGKFEESLEIIKKAFELNPDSLEINETLAILHNLTGDTKKAFEIYESIIKKFPYSIYPYLNYMNLLINNNEDDEADKIFEAGEKILVEQLEKTPEDLDLYVIGSNMYFQMDFIDEAVMLLYRGLKIYPKQYELYRELSVIFYEIGVYDECINVCHESLKYYRQDSTVYLYLGLSMQKMNYLKEALKYLSLSFTLNPEQEELKTLLDKIEEIISTKGETIEEIIRNSKARKKYKGLVKWFDEEKGIGSISCKDLAEEVFLHYTAIQMEGFQTVIEGTNVEFTTKKTDKGYIGTKIWLIDSPSSKRYYGKIATFDDKIGLGIIFNDELGDVNFHYSGLIDRTVKTIDPNAKVEFSIFNIDNGFTQAFNIKSYTPKEEKRPEIISSANRHEGRLKWYDKSVGYGIIETTNGVEIIIQKSNLPIEPSKLENGLIFTFNIDEVEAITGERVPRAINVKLTPVK